MKTSVNLKTPTAPAIKVPYIGKGDFDAAIVMFVATVNGSIAGPRAVKGIILEPGAGDHRVGDWVTYQYDRYPPLVGTVTLEN